MGIEGLDASRSDSTSTSYNDKGGNRISTRSMAKAKLKGTKGSGAEHKSEGGGGGGGGEGWFGLDPVRQHDLVNLIIMPWIALASIFTTITAHDTSCNVLIRILICYMVFDAGYIALDPSCVPRYVTRKVCLRERERFCCSSVALITR